MNNSGDVLGPPDKTAQVFRAASGKLLGIRVDVDGPSSIIDAPICLGKNPNTLEPPLSVRSLLGCRKASEFDCSASAWSWNPLSSCDLEFPRIPSYCRLDFRRCIHFHAFEDLDLQPVAKLILIDWGVEGKKQRGMRDQQRCNDANNHS